MPEYRVIYVKSDLGNEVLHILDVVEGTANHMWKDRKTHSFISDETYYANELLHVKRAGSCIKHPSRQFLSYWWFCANPKINNYIFIPGPYFQHEWKEISYEDALAILL